MQGRKVIITGVPGVGKTTVVNEALKKLKSEGVEYQSINFGSFMFEVAKKENVVQDRDQMRTLDRAVQKQLQQQGRALKNLDKSTRKKPRHRVVRGAAQGNDQAANGTAHEGNHRQRHGPLGRFKDE